MAFPVWIDEVIEKSKGIKPQPKIFITLILLCLIGALSLIGGLLFTNNPSRYWQIFLIDFLILSGISHGGVAISAIFQTVNAQWCRPLKRFGEILGVFIPFSFLLFLILLLGIRYLYPWFKTPVPGKETWLSLSNFIYRNIFILFINSIINFIYIYYSFRIDIGIYVEKGITIKHVINRIIVRNWQGFEKEDLRTKRILSTLSPIVLILYVITFSHIAHDLVMSLSPVWYTTLFGGYYFIGNLYLSFAAVTCVTIYVRKAYGMERFLSNYQLYDLGKLLFSFALLWTYFLWSIYLPIWYSNIPEETSYVFFRTKIYPWKIISLLIIILNFLIPFILLLTKKAKISPAILTLASIGIIIGMILERALLVVPSINLKEYMSLPYLSEAMAYNISISGSAELIITIIITIGFISGFVLAILYFLQIIPILPLGDSVFQQIEDELLFYHGQYQKWLEQKELRKRI